MQFDYKGIGHPTRRQLVDFAESLVDTQATVAAILAAHVAECPKCANEVKRIRACLQLADLSCPPDPSNALACEIMLRARGEVKRPGRPRKYVPVLKTAQYGICAVAAVLLAVYAYTMILNDAAARAQEPVFGNATVAAEQPISATALIQRAETVKALSASVSIRENASDSPHDVEYRRALEILKHDLNAALSALHRNPGNTRANQVMVMSLERQLEGLRDLYLDRTY